MQKLRIIIFKCLANGIQSDANAARCHATNVRCHHYAHFRAHGMLYNSWL